MLLLQKASLNVSPTHNVYCLWSNTNYNCGDNLDDATWAIYANFCVLMHMKVSLIASVACEKMVYVQHLLGISVF